MSSRAPRLRSGQAPRRDPFLIVISSPSAPLRAGSARNLVLFCHLVLIFGKKYTLIEVSDCS